MIFCTSLVTHNYRAKHFEGVKTTNHYCEFSGGGDLCISKSDLSIPLVVVLPPVEDSNEPSESDEQSESDDTVHVSPLHDGESKLACLL